MNMKEHILTALKEEFNQWEELLASMSEKRITTPLPASNWSIKDEIAHLRIWQQLSIARAESALHDRKPEVSGWFAAFDPDGEEDNDLINARIYEATRGLAWSQVYQNWKEGFLRFLETANGVSESDILAGDRYPWLEGHSLAVYLLASYDHHQEHLEKLQTRLREQGEIEDRRMRSASGLTKKWA